MISARFNNFSFRIASNDASNAFDFIARSARTLVWAFPFLQKSAINIIELKQRNPALGLSQDRPAAGQKLRDRVGQGCCPPRVGNALPFGSGQWALARDGFR